VTILRMSLGNEPGVRDAPGVQQHRRYQPWDGHVFIGVGHSNQSGQIWVQATPAQFEAGSVSRQAADCSGSTESL
jgi:hypothetical protein